MADYLNFSNVVTKSLQPINSDDRYFEGYLTVEMKDKQGEITIVDELYKALPIWMDRGAPMSDTHSNRIVGKGINYARTIYKDADGTEYPAIKITGKIFKNYELDNDIWEKIKSGEYKGLSFGGATKTNRTPVVMKDGSIAYALKELEHYEVAVCREPAVPLALITDYNQVAKSIAGYTEDRSDGKMVIRCSKFGCYVEKIHTKEEGEEAKKIMEHEHELKGEKPSVEEKKIHDKVIEEHREKEENKKKADFINKPFGGYENFDACVAANKDKNDPKAYCGYLKHEIEKADLIYKKEDGKKEVELTEDGKKVFDEAKRYSTFNMYKSHKTPLREEFEALLEGKVAPSREPEEGKPIGKKQFKRNVLEENKSLDHNILKFRIKTLILQSKLLFFK
jgi:hypothetical protein